MMRYQWQLTHPNLFGLTLIFLQVLEIMIEGLHKTLSLLGQVVVLNLRHSDETSPPFSVDVPSSASLLPPFHDFITSVVCYWTSSASATFHCPLNELFFYAGVIPDDVAEITSSLR